MAFDFPNSPSVGQRVTGVGGIVYVWDGVKWTNSVGGVTVQSMGDVGRSLLHNPLFNVAQRGAGPWTTAGLYTADRWYTNFVNGTMSTSIVALSDANRTSIGDEAAVSAIRHIVAGSATAGSLADLQQRIEGVRRLAGKTVTVSFWAFAASGAPKTGVSIDQYFGVGGSAYLVGAGQSVTISTAPARYSLTFAVPSASGKTVGTGGDDFTNLIFWFSGATDQNTNTGSVGVQSGTFSLWGVQLEIGSVATPLEKPDPRYDLANCQRFYQVNDFAQNAYALASNAVGVMQLLPVQMRAAPTITINLTFNTNGTGILSLASKTGCEIYLSAVASAGVSFGGNYTASADL